MVQQVQGHRRSGINNNLRRTPLAAFVLYAAQNMDRGVFRAADMAGAAALRAGDETGFRQRRTQALPAHFQQTKVTDMADLDAGSVVLQRILDSAFDHRVVTLGLHVDEVDDDQPGQIAQSQLARDLVGRLQVGAQRGLFDVPFAGGTAGVDVDRDQRLGLVDHQIAARPQLHRRLQHAVELRLDLVTGEQRLPAVAPELNLLGVGRHQHAHEIMRCSPAFLAIHQDFINVA